MASIKGVTEFIKVFHNFAQGVLGSFHARGLVVLMFQSKKVLDVCDSLWRVVEIVFIRDFQAAALVLIEDVHCAYNLTFKKQSGLEQFMETGHVRYLELTSDTHVTSIPHGMLPLNTPNGSFIIEIVQRVCPKGALHNVLAILPDNSGVILLDQLVPFLRGIDDGMRPDFEAWDKAFRDSFIKELPGFRKGSGGIGTCNAQLIEHLHLLHEHFGMLSQLRADGGRSRARLKDHQEGLCFRRGLCTCRHVLLHSGVHDGVLAAGIEAFRGGIGDASVEGMISWGNRGLEGWLFWRLRLLF